jgi:hypothetical protein
MIHLISYGDNNYIKAKKRIYEEAKNTGWFNTITLYGPENLSNNFKNKFKNILNKKRGAGYWIWKSYIIKKKLEQINDNDILIYLDAGFTINKKGGKRFREYIEILNKSDEGILSFQNGQTERLYTTKQIFEYFKVDQNSSFATSQQLLGGIRIMKKNNNLINLINKEYNVYSDNQLLITDYYNKNNQEIYFKDNRHDQSVFSIIRKMSKNPIIIKNESYFKKYGSIESLNFPFWETRKK